MICPLQQKRDDTNEPQMMMVICPFRAMDRLSQGDSDSVKQRDFSMDVVSPLVFPLFLLNENLLAFQADLLYVCLFVVDIGDTTRAGKSSLPLTGAVYVFLWMLIESSENVLNS